MFSLPPNDIFNTSETHEDDYERTTKEADVIVDCLDRLGAHCECEKIDIGPQVIRYSLVAAEGISVRQIPHLKDDLQYELGVKSLSILAPSPGEKYIVLEVPNLLRRIVLLGDVL